MKKHGFTLIELLASLAIISLLVIVGSQILTLSMDISKKSYEDELSFKESSYVIAYIENILRSAYKIEVDQSNPESNIIAYVKDQDKGEVTKHSFRTKNIDSSEYRLLIDDRDNLSNNSDGGGYMQIGRLSSLYLHYDQWENTVHIILNDASKKNRYETFISLGERV